MIYFPKCLGCGVASYKAARWLYFGLFGLYATLAWVCREYGAAFDGIDVMKDCAKATHGEDAIRKCFAKQAVLRLSVATFIFFTMHLFVITALINFGDNIEFAQAAQAGLCHGVLRLMFLTSEMVDT
jgi:hypothetical protein